VDGNGEKIHISIERIVPGGDGLGRHDGRTVFVPLSAPGDELEVRIVDSRPSFVRAEIVDIVVPGPGRAQPVCPLYGECGGCNLMHLSYGAQLQARLDLARDAWRRSGGIESVELDMIESDPLGYRNRAQFHRARSGEIGYTRRSSASVLGVRSCPVLAAPLARWLKEQASGGNAKALEKLLAGKDRFVAFGYGDRAYLEGQDRELTVEIAGKPLRFDIGGFFQSNLGMVEKLVPAVCSGLSGARAADLYCGVGLFGSFLKDRFDHLTCVEQETRALGHACANVGKKATYAATSIEDWTRSAQARERFDYVVVDPPRAGLSAKVRSWLAASRPPVIGYVSCDPVSLARDAGFLVAEGYVVESATVFDFYPQTSHVESYARFRLG